MLNISRFVGNTISVGWFTRLAGPLFIKARPVLLYYSIPAFDKFSFCVFSSKARQVLL
jgi:hypothetical protein